MGTLQNVKEVLEMDSNIIVDSWKKENIVEIVEVWNRNFAQSYHVNETMLMSKIINDRDLFAQGTFVCIQEGKIIGFIATKISDNSLPEYINAAWLSVLLVDKANQRKGLGSFMYTRAEEALKKVGIIKLIVAGEMNNFFSGIPNPCDKSNRFFSKLGFQLNGGEHYDLSADVSTIDFDSLPVTVNRTEEFVSRSLEEQDIPALQLFFDTEFPGRWEYEIMTYIKNGGDFEHVVVLCRGQAVKGFSKIHVSQGEDDFTAQLGYNWGSLGPIGISKDIRGAGLGNRILCDSLMQLKRLGAHNVNIDWTVLKDFYGQFGFTPWRIYLGAYKLLN